MPEKIDIPVEVQTAAKTFGLAPRKISVLAEGRQNDTWRIHCAHQDFVLRRYGVMRFKYKMRSEATVLWEHALLSHLHRGGIAVAPAISSPNGKTVLRIKGDRWSLFPFVPGKALDAATTAEIAMDLLVRFHQCTAKAASGSLCRQRPGVGERLHITSWFLSPKPRVPLAELLKWLEKPDPASNGHLAFSRCRDWIRLATESLIPAQNDPEMSVLPRQPVHGDFVPANLALKRGKPCIVYDLDDCSLDLRSVDLACGMLWWAWTSGGGMNLDTAAKMLRRYHTLSPLSQAEVRYLPQTMIACYLFYVLRNLAMQHHSPDQDRSRSLGHFMPRIQWVLATQRDISEMALRVINSKNRY